MGVAATVVGGFALDKSVFEPQRVADKQQLLDEIDASKKEQDAKDAATWSIDTATSTILNCTIILVANPLLDVGKLDGAIALVNKAKAARELREFKQAEGYAKSAVQAVIALRYGCREIREVRPPPPVN